MRTQNPTNTSTWLETLYQGQLYKLPPDNTSLKLSNSVLALLYEQFGIADLSKIHDTLSEENFFNAMKRIRKQLFTQPYYIDTIAESLLNLGFKPGEVAFEPIRLRAIRHNGHLNPRAKSVYYPHRDTWYGHGQSMIVGWIPLHDQTDQQTFEIYENYFHQPVVNDSDQFNHDTWQHNGTDRKIGWQSIDTGLEADYPQTARPDKLGQVIRFSARKAEQLFFSGSHLHKTLEQTHGISRFSIDYRFVCLADHHNRHGAPNVDNRSSGDAVASYIPL